MEIHNLQKSEQPFLLRTELKGELIFTGKTPNFSELQQVLANNTKSDASLIVVKSIYTEFGKSKARFTAYLYKDAASLNKIEPKKKEKKAKEAKAPAPEKK
ncbi:MAG: hypothetical protein QXD13_01795 [Candidatus Pacearchaeota archaeon]